LSFDYRDIRPAMDIYTLDNVYLGTVLQITPGPVRAAERVDDAARQSSKVSGELLGPMPTQPLGNPGPIAQSARADYATTPDDARPIGEGALTVGKWWGLVDRRRIPLDAVQTVSLERVVLRLRAAALR
jgi:hypothetical protein